MLTNEGEKVLSWIENKEATKTRVMCYSCGLEEEFHGGLCGECLLDRHIPLD